MKRHWICLQLRFEAPKSDSNLALALRRAGLSGNALLIATFSSYNCTSAIAKTMYGHL